MAANTVNAINIIQEKIGSANTTNITTQEMIDLTTAASLISEGCVIESYANTSYFPTANSTVKKLAYDEANGVMYVNISDQWVYIGEEPAGAGGAAGSHFPGSNYGYTSGGQSPIEIFSNTVEKFPFTSDGNASDVGNLTVGRFGVAGQSSTDYGYTSGGTSEGPTNTNIIDKFPFTSDGNATDVGDLTVTKFAGAGQSSTDYGYTSGGPSSNVIDKFPFASDGNATDVGDLTLARMGAAGQSSTDYGYNSGGWSPAINVIDKFPFATDGNASDVGDLTAGRYGPAGQSSTDYGYSSGGWTNTPVQIWYNIIDKFPFASDGNATDVGDLTFGRRNSAGQSSTDYGYTSGGNNPSATNIIDKFPFASDGNATDVGDMTVVRGLLAGQQY